MDKSKIKIHFLELAIYEAIMLTNGVVFVRLAQLVEQLTLNQLVRGSSPRPGTIQTAPYPLKA